MQTKFDARDEVVKMIEGYMAEEGFTKKDAINELIHAGWIAKHQDLLAGTLVSDIRKAMDAVIQADKRDREDELDELLIEFNDRLIEVRAMTLASLLLNDKSRSHARIQECYDRALDMLVGK